MSDSSLLFGAPQWAWPAAAVAAGLLLILVWAYRDRSMPSGWRWLAAALKATGLATLLFCLVEPMRRGERPRPKANLLPILVDDSRSMTIDPSGVGDPEGSAAALRERLHTGQPWNERLEQDFDVRRYAFDARLRSVEDYFSLSFEGVRSGLGEALKRVESRFRDRPVAGVLLFSDGNTTEALEDSLDWSRWKMPVYPVIKQSHSKSQDLRVDSVAVSQSHFEASPVTIDARIAASGLAGEPLAVQLVDEKENVVEEQTVDAPSDNRLADIRFRFRPEESGIQSYRVSVCLESEQEMVAEGKTKTEVTLRNNQRLVTVDRPRGPFRVLYVSGRPNWEFKFLRRALAEDAEVELVGLVRIARQQPKFSFRDDSVPETNPLFAGLGEDEEEAAEQYDEPVILRLGVAESQDLRAGFPEDAEELFRYHAVLLDDLEAGFFSADQRLLLRRFVAARGGGLMMLGGQESFAKGGYQQTPIGEMLPVYLQPPSAVEREKKAPSFPGPYRFRLTREGMLQPWLRLRPNELDEGKRFDALPPYRVVNQVRDAKPGAVVLATVENAENKVAPAIVSQRFGKGRTAALLIGDLWRQAMRRDDNDRGDPEQAWRQLIRQMVSDVPRRVELQVLNHEQAASGRPLAVQLTVRDERYLPLDNAQVDLKVMTPNEETIPLTVRPSNEEAGVYSATFWSTEPGDFVLSATVTAPDGSVVGTAETGWASEPDRAEFQTLTPNVDLLAQIAERTGGEIIDPDRLDAFVDSLQNRKVPVTESWVYPIWHHPWILGFAIGCLCCEWGLRRWKGWP